MESGNVMHGPVGDNSWCLDNVKHRMQHHLDVAETELFGNASGMKHEDVAFYDRVFF